MANKNEGNEKGKKRKQHRYLPHNKPVKKKGSYPLRPGVQGFFITCDGGREREASHEATNVIDSFFEELIEAKDACTNSAMIAERTSNKKIKFSYSDSSDSDGEEEDDNNDENISNEKEKVEDETEAGSHADGDATNGGSGNGKSVQEENSATASANNNEDVEPDSGSKTNEAEEPPTNGGSGKGKSDQEDNPVTASANNDDNVKPDSGSKTNEVEEPPMKKQCHDGTMLGLGSGSHTRDKVQKSVDKLIEAELQELGDKKKRRFVRLDSGCNGVVFIQMQKRDGDPGPKEIVQHMMGSSASTRKQISRYLLRVLPIEVACYASEEEISRAIKPVITRYFPAEAETPVKFAVLYDARANSGIDRMKIIDTVAKSVPGPHKVDLKTPDKNIVIQIVKTVCLIGVVEKYKEFAKYNLRQLTSKK